MRSPQEYSGELIAMAGYEQEGAQRAGHIPGAASVPWAQAVKEDGTFKDADELRELYSDKGVVNGNPIIAYCRIGERSAHTWFVLHELLGEDDVKNYDGSWTEWGNMVARPDREGRLEHVGASRSRSDCTIRAVAPQTRWPSTVYVGVLIGTPLRSRRCISWPATRSARVNSRTWATSLAWGRQAWPGSTTPTNGKTR